MGYVRWQVLVGSAHCSRKSSAQPHMHALVRTHTHTRTAEGLTTRRRCGQFALVPFRQLADKNDTNLPVAQSGGTYICPMADGCCYNPGEDKDENAVVREGVP